MSQIKVNRTNGETDTLEFESPNESYIRISNLKSNKRIFVSFNYDSEVQIVSTPVIYNTEVVRVSPAPLEFKDFLTSREIRRKTNLRNKLKKAYSKN